MAAPRCHRRGHPPPSPRHHIVTATLWVGRCSTWPLVHFARGQAVSSAHRLVLFVAAWMPRGGGSVLSDPDERGASLECGGTSSTTTVPVPPSPRANQQQGAARAAALDRPADSSVVGKFHPEVVEIPAGSGARARGVCDDRGVGARWRNDPRALRKGLVRP